VKSKNVKSKSGGFQIVRFQIAGFQGEVWMQRFRFALPSTPTYSPNPLANFPDPSRVSLWQQRILLVGSIALALLVPAP
jgi:hypothetical protein